MILNFSIVQAYFLIGNWISLYFFPFVIKDHHILFIMIVFRLGSDKLVSCFFYCLFPRYQSRDVIPCFGEGGWFLIFDCSSPFCFLLIELHYAFSISNIVLTYYVYYYYCIWLCFNSLFSCSFAGFLLFLSRVSSFRLLLLQLCNNRCVDALAVELKFSIESPLLRLMRLNS